MAEPGQRFEPDDGRSSLAALLSLLDLLVAPGSDEPFSELVLLPEETDFYRIGFAADMSGVVARLTGSNLGGLAIVGGGELFVRKEGFLPDRFIISCDVTCFEASGEDTAVSANFALTGFNEPVSIPGPGDEPASQPTASTGLVRGSDISGKVTDASTKLPVRDAYIVAESVIDDSSFDTNAESDGTYIITGLPPGIYQIRAEHQETGYVSEYYDDTSLRDQAALVTVRASESVSGIDFGLTRGASISGIVVDVQTGLPIRDAEVKAESISGNENVYADTDADGRYTLSGLAPGSYLVRAKNNDLGYIREYYDGKRDEDEADLITVGSEDVVQRIDFKLDAGATVTGKVTNAATGQPIADVDIDANPLERGSGADDRTDDSGEYRLTGLAPGSYRLRARGEDHGYANEYYGQTAERQFEAVEVTGLEPVGGIDFAFRPASTISGRVTDAATGLPIRDIEVGAEPLDIGRSEYTRTGFNGRYTIQGLLPGSYYVSTEDGGDTGHIEQYYQAKVHRDEANIVAVAEGAAVANVDFVLTSGATISGRVTDTVTGQPIANVGVGAEQEDRSREVWTNTDNDGKYVIRGIVPGNNRVRARGGDYIEQYYNNRTSWNEADLVSVDGDSVAAGIDFALKAGATITGLVTDAVTGRPIADVKVRAEPTGDGPSSSDRTDSNGRYAVTGLGPGNHRVWADASDLGYIEVYWDNELRWDDADPVAVSEEGTETGYDFRLRIGETISGTVTDSQTGLPIQDIEVRANHADGGSGASDRTDVNGRYTIRGLATGRYSVRPRGEDRGYARLLYKDKLRYSDADTVTVAEGGVTGIHFALRPAATISGKVTDAATGQGIRNMEVRALLGSEELEYTETDSTGEYELRGIPEAEVTVTVSGQGYVEQRRTVFVEEGQHIEGFDF